MGSDSAETRARILRAARAVINERGYEAAKFQAIAQRAGFSRPTMHYYFHTKEQVYDSLQQEAYSIVSDCIAQARRENTLLKQLAKFVTAAQRMDLADGSMMRFIIASRLELHRNPAPARRQRPGRRSSGRLLQVDGRRRDPTRRASGRHRRGGSGEHAVRNVLGDGLLRRLRARAPGHHGNSQATSTDVRPWLAGTVPGDRPLTIAPPVPADVVVGEFARPWQAVVDPFVEGVGRFDPLDAATRPAAHPDAV